jgi:nucleoside-diphosphate-sugar epimerase
MRMSPARRPELIKHWVMHVLVAGGAGYLGSTLVPHLLAAGHHVTVVDRFYFGEEPLSGAAQRFPGRLRLVRRDVRHMTPADFENVDALVDLAGIANDPSCDLDPELTRAINLEAATRLAQTALRAGTKRLVFASSCSVYGQGKSSALTEDSPLAPVSLYARCKAEAETRLRELGAGSDISLTILRLATLFGVSGRTRFDVAINVMSKNAYVLGRITVDGGGRQWRPFVHVRDVAEVVLLILAAPKERVAGRVFNVGSEVNNLRIISVAYRVREQVPNAEIICAATDPDRRDYHVCFQRLRGELGFEPQIGVDDGIREIVAALRDGSLDPDDRRCYTLRQYSFLADVERTFHAVAIDGRVLH